MDAERIKREIEQLEKDRDEVIANVEEFYKDKIDDLLGLNFPYKKGDIIEDLDEEFVYQGFYDGYIILKKIGEECVAPWQWFEEFFNKEED